MDDARLTADPSALASLERKLEVVRDHVTGVAKGYKHGYFLHGTGGLGKSYTVLTHLEAIDAPHKLFNSRMTAKGLFVALADAPDVVHVLEDMERLVSDKDAQGVLRSALWSQPGRDRVVTWTTATDGAQRFVFRGGLILISNRPLADMPELRALATRIEVHRLEVSTAELEAMMMHLAAQGHMRGERVAIEPAEATEVTGYLLAECRRAGCPLDLRLQQKAFATFLQWEADHTANHWRDLIAVRVAEAAHHFKHEADLSPSEDRKARARKAVREIMAETADEKEQVRLYKERTGRSRADFYRKKRQVESGEFDPEEAG